MTKRYSIQCLLLILFINTFKPNFSLSQNHQKQSNLKYLIKLKMENKHSVAILKFNLLFMKLLKNNRQKAIKAVEQSKDTQDFIIQILSQHNISAHDFARQMKKNQKPHKLYEKLRKTLSKKSQSMSQQQYDQLINEFQSNIQTRFFLIEQTIGENQIEVIFKKGLDPTEEKNYENFLFDQESDPKMNDNFKDFAAQNHFSISFIKVKRADRKPESYIKSKQFKKAEDEEQNIQQLQMQQNQFKAVIFGNQKPSFSQHIKAQDLFVQVRFLKSKVDYEKYESNGFPLKLHTQNFIRKYLGENKVIVRRQVPEIKIMEQIDFIKSKEAGNYRFNPFCDALQIWLKLKNEQIFNKNFIIEGDINKLSIIPKPIEANEWDKTFLTLTTKSTIQQIVKYICQKRQIKSDLCNKLCKGLIQLGGANVAQDLFGWERSDFTKLNIQPTVIFQIQEVIEQIKDSSNLISRKDKNQQKLQCIKNAISHKILRYVVYKTEGQAGLKKISWLNLKNLKKAIYIVRKQIHNKELLDQLQDYFCQFALSPDGKPLSFSRGMILFGPPGTGKTVLTEALPNIIGFHLIQNGLSAADFSKSLVGQTSRMIKDLVNRAAISPWLLCSIGIDEVDGLVPDRKDKDEKNKAQGISIMLSVIGGNKDVPNLVYMTSTNYIKKIDEAIGRRLNGKFQVGRPSPMQREIILKEKVQYLNGNSELLQHLACITTNFTGAALGGLGNNLLKSLKMKKQNHQVQQLTIDQVTNATIVIAKQFNITFGSFTLPEIYRNQSQKKFIFTETFLKRISKHFLFVKNVKGDEYKIMYANQIQKFYQGKLTPIYEQQQDRINVTVKDGKDFQSFVNYVKIIFESKKYEFKYFSSQNYRHKYNKYSSQIKQFLDEKEKKHHKKTVLIIQDHPDSVGEIQYTAKLFERNHTNLYIIYYILPEYDMNTFSGALFGQKISQISSQSSSHSGNYTGRIMVELNQETRMAFQLKNCIQMESKVAFRLFLKSEEGNSPKTVIPELVDFFTKKQVSYLLLLDYDLLLQNDAFEEKKILQVLEEKMLQAKSYKRSAVIIDLDSLILLNENASDSSMGRSTSYSIQNFNLYQILLSYMREFASTVGSDSRWLTMIVKHPELVSTIKKQLSWPKYPEEIQKSIEEQSLDKQRRCFRCKKFYKQRQNREERKCIQHPGRIIDTVLKQFQDQSADRLKAKILAIKKKDEKSEQNRYIYSCCMKGLNQQCDREYYHITKDQFETEQDQVYMDNNQQDDEWNQKLKYFDQ